MARLRPDKNCAHPFASMTWSIKGLCCKACGQFWTGDAATRHVFLSAKEDIKQLSFALDETESGLKVLGLVKCQQCGEWHEKRFAFEWTPGTFWCADCIKPALDDLMENRERDLDKLEKKRIVSYFFRHRTMLETLGTAKWFVTTFPEEIHAAAMRAP